MIIQEALAFGRNRLSHSSSPTLDARLLLEFVLEKSHTYLIAHGEMALTVDQETHYRQLIHLAAQHEPVPYLTGQAPFLGRLFLVNSAVLIPRPETEQLVECAIEWAASREQLKVVEIGTGSGIIAVSLALALPHTDIEAVDISEAALAVARQNAKRFQVTKQIRFQPGNLLEPIDGPIDLIVANLPYITDAEWTGLADGVKSYEPTSALRGGRNGLDFIDPLLGQAKEQLAPEGAVFLEIGWKQGPAVITLAEAHFPDKQVNLLVDFAGNDRIISIT